MSSIFQREQELQRRAIIREYNSALADAHTARSEQIRKANPDIITVGPGQFQPEISDNADE